MKKPKRVMSNMLVLNRLTYYIITHDSKIRVTSHLYNGQKVNYTLDGHYEQLHKHLFDLLKTHDIHNFTYYANTNIVSVYFTPKKK